MLNILLNFDISKIGQEYLIEDIHYKPLISNVIGYSGKIYYRCYKNDESYILVYFPPDIVTSDEIFVNIKSTDLPQMFYYLWLNRFLNYTIQGNPKVLDTNSNCILLQDLGDTLLYNYIYNEDLCYPYYISLISWLINFQTQNTVTLIRKRKLEKKALFLEVSNFIYLFYNVL